VSLTLHWCKLLGITDLANSGLGCCHLQCSCVFAVCLLPQNANILYIFPVWYVFSKLLCSLINSCFIDCWIFMYLAVVGDAYSPDSFWRWVHAIFDHSDTLSSCERDSTFWVARTLVSICLQVGIMFAECTARFLLFNKCTTVCKAVHKWFDNQK